MFITDTAPVRKRWLGAGIGYMVVSTVCFSVMQTLVKLMPQFDSFQHVFFRSVIGWLLCVLVLRAKGLSLVGKNTRMLLVRGLIGSLSMFSFFYVLPRIPFATSVTLKYLSPVFTAFFAVWFLHERIKPAQWLCITISFAGVLLLKGFDPRIGLFDLGVGLVSAISGGLLYIVIKKIGDDDHPLVILHYFMAISAVVSGAVSVAVWRNPTWLELAGLAAVGVIGFFAQNYFTKAVQASDQVSSLANVRYLEAAYALIIGYVLFGEIYSLTSSLGIVLIFSGLLGSLQIKARQRRCERTPTVVFPDRSSR